VGLGLEVARQPEGGLQYAGSDLLAQGEQADLQIGEAVILLEQRVEHRQQELQQVVEQMRAADGQDDGQGGALRIRRRAGRNRGHGNNRVGKRIVPSYPAIAARAIVRREYRRFGKEMAPRAGLEPATIRLTVERSTN